MTEIQEQNPFALSKEEFIRRQTEQAEQRYDKYRERRPAVQCVGYTNTGKRCEAFAIAGTNLCDKHGGNVQKHGHAELVVLPPQKKRKINIAGRINEIRNLISEDQQNILDSTEEIEVLTARFQYLLEVSEDLPQMSKKVIEEYDKWVDVRQSGNKVRFAEQTSRLSKAIEDCRPGVLALGEFYTLAETLRRFKETEMKRRIAMRQMLDAGDAAKLIDTMKQCFEICLLEIDDVLLRKSVKRAFSKAWRTSFTITVKEPTRRDLDDKPNPMR